MKLPPRRRGSGLTVGHVVIAVIFGCIGLLAVPMWKLFGPRDYSLPTPPWAEVHGSDGIGQTTTAGSSSDPERRILGQIPNSMPAQPATPPTPSAPAQPFPDNGTVLTFQQLPEGQAAGFTVDAMASSSLNIVKLEEWNTQRPVLVTFVRGGTVSSIKVPFGVYRVKMAGGEAWYGLDDLFGPSTQVQVGDKPLQFYSTGDTITGHTLYLQRTPAGNFPTSREGRRAF
ncbi:hypothetical protein AB4Z48_12005 [Cupriavidus sp. 2TAF22]|uniref:hypothetical protein n=1 Tax=unclassified Cupriavidus TaxID=2640874 RepID=UPI003F90894B